MTPSKANNEGSENSLSKTKKTEDSPSTVKEDPSSKPSKKTKSRHRRHNLDSFSVYLYRVLQEIHPDIGISSKAMNVMNSFVNDLFDRISREASKLLRYNNTRTITARDIQTAVRLLLPDGLGRHAVSEGMKAIAKYSGSKMKDTK
ncbi:unnamed protein product [Thelazia callipaeda]|uniref:Histone domain-containing protein n=1 Tax=Thelazia callipaeda TaxID=103827 RepID=A0A0N5CQ29_THECL|nr:unnamed protein product [Thelazia callipaeda]